MRVISYPYKTREQAEKALSNILKSRLSYEAKVTIEENNMKEFVLIEGNSVVKP